MKSFKKKRIELKLSRKKMAKKLGLSDYKLRKLEEGEHEFTEEQVSQYKAILDANSSEEDIETSELLNVALTPSPTLSEAKSKARQEKAKRAKQPTKKLSKKEEQLWEINDSIVLKDNEIIVDTEEKLKSCAEDLYNAEYIVLDTETWGAEKNQAKHPHKAWIAGISMLNPDSDNGYWVPIKSNYMECLSRETIKKYLSPVLSKTREARYNLTRRVKIKGVDTFKNVPVPYKLITHNMRFDLHVTRYMRDPSDKYNVLNHLGIELPYAYYDTLTGAWLLDETESHVLKDLWNKYCSKGEKADRFNKLFGNVTMEKVPPKVATRYAIKDVFMTWDLAQFQLEQFNNNSSCAPLAKLLWETELPALWVSYEAEKKGIRMDLDYLKNAVSPYLHGECDRLYDKILEIYVREGLKVSEDKVEEMKEKHRLREQLKKDGTPYSTPKYEGFNLNSNPQKQEFIFDMLGLPEINGRSLNAKKVLKKLKGKHPVVELLMRYNKATKLKSAFADALPNQVFLCEDGAYRVFPSINSIGAKTYRQSCNSPNMQQIPSSGEEFKLPDGTTTTSFKLLRNAFIADEGRLLLSVDFSQQELRVLADASQDKVLIQAFLDGKDVHSLTASNIIKSQLSMAKDSIDQLIKAIKSEITGTGAGVKTSSIARALAGLKRFLYEESMEEEERYIEKLSNMSAEQILGEAQWLKDNPGLYYTLGSNYEIFELIRHKEVKETEIHRNKGDEVEKVVGVKPLDHALQRLSYEDPSKVKELYDFVLTLDDNDYIALADYFESRRKKAKTVNFGVVYGMTEIGLSDAIGVDKDTAKSFIEGYLDGYPGVRRAMKKANKEIRKNTYIVNNAGYKRRFYQEFEKMASDRSMRWLIGTCERQGFNFLVQSPSAYMTKRAEIDLMPVLDRIGGYFILPVHDEVLLDVPATITMEQIQEIKEVMQNAVPLCVPMKSDAEIGAKWGECRDASEVHDFLALAEDSDDSNSPAPSLLPDSEEEDDSHGTTEVKEKEVNIKEEKDMALKDLQEEKTYTIEDFQEELNLIKTPIIKEVVTDMLKKAPNYFWTVPASPSGKYHPSISLGNGGLVRHTKAAVMVAESMLRNEAVIDIFFPEGLSDKMRDVVVGALILHDTCKQGFNGGEHTVTEHPLLVRELTKEIDPRILRALDDTDKAMLGAMMDAIETHMGPWTYDYKTKRQVLLPPATGLQNFVHLCDYIASRKYIGQLV